MNVNFSDLKKNQTTSKKRKYNSYEQITELVKAYKETNDNDILLKIISELSGIINSFTIICTPKDLNQNIIITPYMKKLLGMFLSKKKNGTGISFINANDTYMNIVYKIRKIMRHYDYEDMYSKLIEFLIHTIKTMRIIGTCNCIYYIQLLLRYKMYNLIVRTARDASAHIHEFDYVIESDDYNDLSLDNKIKRKMKKIDVLSTFTSDEAINKIFCEDIDLIVIVNQNGIYKIFTQLEKQLIYLTYVLEYKENKILKMLNVQPEELNELYLSIDNKFKLIKQEYNNI